ncbi:hypothetical protein [Dactylosporangium sp. NPDC048998]|uniref:hypothetical protein n=1 Tax=Dactylosporangium sp. NPDC048998 TaxID=3363976 RepID=UPI003720CA3F
MSWAPLLSAVIGAVIALGSSLLVDVRRDRSQRGRDRQQERRRQGVAFTVALVDALGALRPVAAAGRDAAERRVAAGEAVAPVYAVREQLLVTGTPGQLAAGESAFHALIGVRDAVRDGSALDSAEYHDAYHLFAEALWRFRLTVRADLGEPELTPEELSHPDWTDRDRCDTCQSRALPSAM